MAIVSFVSSSPCPVSPPTLAWPLAQIEDLPGRDKAVNAAKVVENIWRNDTENNPFAADLVDGK